MNIYKEYGTLTLSDTKEMPYNPTNGQFLKGHTPHNKGKHPLEYMDEESYQKILNALNKSRQGNPNLGGHNKKAVIMIKEGKICGAFESSEDARRKTGINGRNIRSTCDGKRKTAGGYQWFWESSEDWIDLVK